MMQNVFDLIIIGGGASGLFAASMVSALTSGKTRVIVIDGNDRCGKKLALTGSGRCNLSNKNAAADKYHTDCPERLDKCLGSFGPGDAVSFFENTLGIATVCDDGLYYPSTYRAATVIDSFRFYLEESGTSFKFGSKCSKITHKNGSFTVVLEDGSEYVSGSLVCATGGATYPSTGSTGSVSNLLGGIITPGDFTGFKPALTSLTSRLPGIKALSGLRIRSRVKLSSGGWETYDSSEGEVIFTKEGGISGICVMDISGKAVEMLNKGMKPVVTLNLSGIPEEDTERILEDRRSKFGRRNISGALAGLMPRILCEFACRSVSLDPAVRMDSLKDREFKALSETISSFKIPVDGFGGADKAQVSSGGIRLSSVDDTMQYKSCKGLYIIGEALNVDGRCGGYNLQWAWSSAAAAAQGVTGNV